MRPEVVEALSDVDTTWALLVLAVMLGVERNIMTKHRACELLAMHPVDYDTWRRRFATFGREMAIRLAKSTR